MNLKIGGNNVGKIMYNGQEFGGATKLEPGTILYMSETLEKDFKNVHLLSTTKNWSNLNRIKILLYGGDFSSTYGSIDISSDDFKNLNEAKTYKIKDYDMTTTVSRTIVDGEYRINISISSSRALFQGCRILIKAI